MPTYPFPCTISYSPYTFLRIFFARTVHFSLFHAMANFDRAMEQDQLAAIFMQISDQFRQHNQNQQQQNNVIQQLAGDMQLLRNQVYQ